MSNLTKYKQTTAGNDSKLPCLLIQEINLISVGHCQVLDRLFIFIQHSSSVIITLLTAQPHCMKLERSVGNCFRVTRQKGLQTFAFNDTDQVKRHNRSNLWQIYVAGELSSTVSIVWAKNTQSGFRMFISVPPGVRVCARGCLQAMQCHSITSSLFVAEPNRSSVSEADADMILTMISHKQVEKSLFSRTLKCDY